MIHRMTLRLRMILVFCVVVTAFMMGIYTVVYSTFASGVMIIRYDRMMDRAVPFIALLQYPAGKEILQQFDLRTQSFEVIDAGGHVIMKSKNLGSDDLPPIDVKNHTQAISQTIDTKLGSMREVVVPFIMQGKNTWFVLVERASGIARLEEDFRKKFVVFFASCLVITALLATWYVMRSLRPILLLTREAEELTHRISPAGLYTPTPKLPVRNPFDEVGRLATTFNVLFERVDSVVQQLQLFVSDAAHEIRTPLAILRGETQLLLAQPRGVLEYQQTLTALDGELATMGRIVEGLFTLSMADSGQLKIVGDKVYLHEILDEACGIVAPLAREKQITIETSDWKEQPLVGDQTMLRQLFLILIENAIKYSAPQTTIQVNLDIVQDQPTVTIQDQGMGIAPDDLPHVFKRFYRAAPQTSGESRSGGLGLAIAEAIITAHHGTICCQSTLGVGSIFTVSFTAADLLSIRS